MILKEALQDIPDSEVDALVDDFKKLGATVVKIKQGDGKWTVTSITLSVDDSSPEAPWLEIARKELGVKEIEGIHNNERILEYQQTTTLAAKDDETPWCSAFVNWCMKQAGIAGTGSALARSWLKWGLGLETPRLGCVVVFRRPPDPNNGHVAFYLRTNGDAVEVLGGNQGNSVSIKEYLNTRVLSYRWPG